MDMVGHICVMTTLFLLKSLYTSFIDGVIDVELNHMEKSENYGLDDFSRLPSKIEVDSLEYALTQ